MISFQNITKIYPQSTVALENVSFDIQEGEFVSIVGKSGAGKTTLIRLLLALEEPTSGNIFFQTLDVHKIKSSKLQKMRRKIGVIHQDYKLLSTKTVYENISYVMAVKGVKDKKIRQEIPRILEFTGLSEKVKNFPKELSGGEQQRLAIARAIVNQPDFIIADEPTGNLDPYNTYDVISLLKKINEMGKTVFLATHDRGVINKLGKRVITLENGKKIRDDKEGSFLL